MTARSGAAASLLLLALLAGSAQGREISGRTTFRDEVVVPAGETWTVRPGADVRFRGGKWTVRGTLVVAGTADRPVRISGDDAWEGIDFRGADGSVVEHAVISGGSRGARLTDASVTFRKVRWEKNAIAVEVGQYAKARIEGCGFESPARVGVLVGRGGAAVITGSRFSRAGKAGLYVSGAREVSVSDCRFEENDAGVIASMPGARVVLSRSLLEGNGTGLRAEKMAAPSVTDCEIAGNRVGLLFTRRAEGAVSGNRIAGNGDGAVVEFSSYPVFRGNRFRGNREAAVRLRHQSSEWEEEMGDAGREVPEGSIAAPFGGREGRRGDFNPRGAGAAATGPPGKKAGLTGSVDFRENDWGELAAEAAAGGNVSGIHDGHDEPEFEYAGKRYRMDRVLLK